MDNIKDKEMRDIPFMSEKDDLEKGVTLMEEAIRQYKEGKYSLANHSRKAANRFLDKLEYDLSSEEGAEKAMYGENRNFGLIYNVIEENANRLYETAEGRKAITTILNTIKNSETLLNEFRVYDAFTNPMDVNDAESYVNEAVSVIERPDASLMKEENTKLTALVQKLGLDESLTVSDDMMDLYEAIEYALLNKPSISNVKEYADAKRVMRENVERRNQQSPKNYNVDELRDKAVFEITEKYNKDMNDDEKRLVEDIATSPEKAEKRFNEVKSNLLSELKSKMNDAEGEDKDGWKEIYETVNSKTFEKENALKVISDILLLQETIE